MTITFTEADIISSDNHNLTLLSGNFPTTFHKTDTDFAAIALGGITAPEGRFIGVRVCYNTDRTVKLTGATYHGAAGAGGLVDGSTISTTGTSTAISNNSITVSTAAGNALSGYVVGNGTNNCSSSYFATPVCVTNDASHCQTGDKHIDPGTVVPNLNIMLDLFNSVGVDGANLTLDNHIPIYPYPTIGTPGASMHLTDTSGSNIANVSLLFGNDKALLYTSAYSNNTFTGLCGGVGFVSVTAGPAGAFMNSYGPTAVQSFNSSTGKLQFATGNCGTSNTCVSSGINVLDNVNQTDAGHGGGPVNISCVADSAATPPYLGFTYTSGAGNGGPAAFTISKIVDPANVLGHCASSPCGSY
jgi:hypothetical protein